MNNRKGRNTREKMQDVYFMSKDGVLPPHDIEAEEVVLGSLMSNPDFLMYVNGIEERMFYKEENVVVFSAIKKLHDSGVGVDILSVMREIRNSGKDLSFVNGSLVIYISKLTNKVTSVEMFFTRELKVVVEHYVRRTLITTTADITRMCYMPTRTLEEIMETFSNVSMNSNIVLFGSNTSKVGAHTKDLIDSIAAAMSNGKNIIGLDSGFNSVNFFLSGWRNECLIVLAGRPGMGKTAFILCSLLFMALNGIPVALFSLEMSTRQLIVRLVSLLSGLSADQIEKPSEANFNSIFSYMSVIEKLPLYIDDTTNDINTIRSRSKELISKHGVKLIAIDYIQLCNDSTSEGNREQEISSISRKLKTITRTEKVPVVALSQLSRSVETRGGDKRPMLSDLRESGAIEQDADVVGFLYRAEYYGIDVDEDGESTSGMGTFITAKNRHGSVGDAKMRFAGRVTEWFNIDGLPIREQRKHIELSETNDLELL